MRGWLAVRSRAGLLAWTALGLKSCQVGLLRVERSGKRIWVLAVRMGGWKRTCKLVPELSGENKASCKKDGSKRGKGEAHKVTGSMWAVLSP